MNAQPLPGSTWHCFDLIMLRYISEAIKPSKNCHGVPQTHASGDPSHTYPAGMPPAIQPHLTFTRPWQRPRTPNLKAVHCSTRRGAMRKAKTLFQSIPCRRRDVRWPMPYCNKRLMCTSENSQESHDARQILRWPSSAPPELNQQCSEEYNKAFRNSHVMVLKCNEWQYKVRVM